MRVNGGSKTDSLDRGQAYARQLNTLIRDITQPLFAVSFPIVLSLPVCVRVHGCNRSVVAGLCEASAGLRLVNLMDAVQFIVAGLRASHLWDYGSALRSLPVCILIVAGRRSV